MKIKKSFYAEGQVSVRTTNCHLCTTAFLALTLVVLPQRLSSTVDLSRLQSPAQPGSASAPGKRFLPWSW